MSRDHEWRTLALQFDNHRMQAIAHLQMLLSDPVKHASVARDFLMQPPLNGEAVLKQRIEELHKEFLSSENL